VSLVFLGKFRGSDEDWHHAHEAPGLMRWPLILLAAGSIAVGYVGVPHFLGGSNRIEGWLAPATAAGYIDLGAAPHGAGAIQAAQHGVEAVHEGAAEHAAAAEWAATLVAFLAAAAGLLLGYQLYGRRPELSTALAARFAWLQKLWEGKYFVDEFYDAVVVRPLRAISENVLWRGIDVRIIDGLLNLLAGLSKVFSYGVRLLQSGYVQTYVMVVVLGVLVLLWRGM